MKKSINQDLFSFKELDLESSKYSYGELQYKILKNKVNSNLALEKNIAPVNITPIADPKSYFKSNINLQSIESSTNKAMNDINFFDLDDLYEV